MAKTYTVHYSSKVAYRGATNNLAPQSGAAEYLAGIRSDGQYKYGVYCRFNGLASINAANVTELKVYIQRIVGGANITYSVELYQSVLSSDPADDGNSIKTGYDIFTENRAAWVWNGNSSDVGGEYRNITIDKSLFNSLKQYGFALCHRSQQRTMNVGDVYVQVTTSETDYTLSYNANGGSGR